MIFMVTGKPRAGKSYYTLMCVIKELADGRRCVVTNLPLNVGELAAYLQARYPTRSIDVLQRLRVLTPAETQKFWLYRRPETPADPTGRVDDVTPEQERRGQFPTWPDKYLDVLYVIDEAHIHFDARRWAEAGHSLTYYNSQHAKLGDHVYFVTQFLDLIDKRVKGFAQEYIYVVNQGFRRLFSLFSLPKYITADGYAQPAQQGRSSVMSEWTIRWRIDPRMGACYRTTSGVGVSGAAVPEEAPRRGLSVWWLIPAIACLGLAFAGAVKAGSYGVHAAIAQTKQPTMIDTHPTVIDRPAVTRLPPPPPPPTAAAAPPPVVYVTGVVSQGRHARVDLSDGTVLFGPEVVRLTATHVTGPDGARYPRRYNPPRNARIASVATTPAPESPVRPAAK